MVPWPPHTKQAKSYATAGDFRVLLDVEGLPRNSQTYLLERPWGQLSRVSELPRNLSLGVIPSRVNQGGTLGISQEFLPLEPCSHFRPAVSHQLFTHELQVLAAKPISQLVPIGADVDGVYRKMVLRL